MNRILFASLLCRGNQISRRGIRTLNSDYGITYCHGRLHPYPYYGKGNGQITAIIYFRAYPTLKFYGYGYGRLLDYSPIAMVG